MGTLEKNLHNMLLLITGLIIVLVSLETCIVLRLRKLSLEVEYLTNVGIQDILKTCWT